MRVCIKCGYFVFNGDRCRRDGGLGVPWQSALSASRVDTLFAYLHIPPAARVFDLERRRHSPRIQFAKRSGNGVEP